MSVIILLLASVFQFGAIANNDAQTSRGERLVFEGTVLNIAPPLPMSGDAAFYRLAKYRIERVCRGRYTKSEIIVDHLSLTAKELDAIKVGDRVCVSVRPSKKIFMRTDVEGIRTDSGKVKIFYIGGMVLPPGSSCECS